MKSAKCYAADMPPQNRNEMLRLADHLRTERPLYAIDGYTVMGMRADGLVALAWPLCLTEFGAAVVRELGAQNEGAMP
jgi:hypothetical protein